MYAFNVLYSKIQRDPFGKMGDEMGVNFGGGAGAVAYTQMFKNNPKPPRGPKIGCGSVLLIGTIAGGAWLYTSVPASEVVKFFHQSAGYLQHFVSPPPHPPHFPQKASLIHNNL